MNGDFILGISCYYHDSAACLVNKGMVVACAEEERFNRQKHYNGFPHLAIRFCLNEAQINADQLDNVVFYEKPFLKFNRILETYVASWPRSFGSFKRAVPLWLKNRLNMRKHLADQLFVDEEKVCFGEHHLSHAASAFLASPFERAAILTMDGVGEWATTTFGFGDGNHIQIDREIRFPHSLGLLYSAITSYLGFRVNDAEWKVMGLAPYGEPRYTDKFRDLIDVKEDGSFRLNMKYFAYHYSSFETINRRFERHFGQPKRRPDQQIDRFHRDVAASGQKVVMDTIVKIATVLQKKYGTDKLTIGGGVGLNSVANWKIIQETDFKDVFIQPAAGDSGGALGAALGFYNLTLKKPRHYVMNHTYLGPEYSDEEIQMVLDHFHADYRKIDDEKELVEETADLLSREKVIGWFQGRMEFGPRALGNRSILASPKNPKMKDIINSKVKFREDFRPFGPSVLEEKASECFDIRIPSPFMLLVPQVHTEKRRVIPAVTHVDGSARLQTVERAINPLYHSLLQAFQRKAGIPVLLNTSFNVRGEPIVMTPVDAYSCFMRTGIDALVMGSYLVSGKDPLAVDQVKGMNIMYLDRDQAIPKGLMEK